MPTLPRLAATVLLAATTLAATTLAATAQPPQPSTHAGGPRVSPDGRHVLFFSDRDGRPDLWLVGADGSGERRLTDSPEHERGAQWLDGGRRVAFGVYDRQSDTTRIYAMSLDGGARALLAAGRGLRGAALSPDGRRLVVSEGTYPAMRLVVVELATGARRPLTPADGRFAHGAEWSPDGARLVYASADVATRESRLLVADADGGNARVVVAGRGVEQPAWSRDGRWIAYQRSGGEGTHDATVHVVPAAGGEPRLLTPHDRPWLDETPSWFPDGRRLAIQSDRGGRMELWVVPADGGGARRLVR